MSYDDHCHALLGVGTPESHSKDKTCYDSRKANLSTATISFHISSWPSLS